MSGPYCVECEHCGSSMEWVIEESYRIDDDVECYECGAAHFVTTCCYGEGGSRWW